MEQTFDHYLESQTTQAKEKLIQIFDWIDTHYPQFEKVIKWNQPMYTNHETFIIGFSTSKKHLAISPEPYVVQKFQKELVDAQYNPTSNLFRITWDQAVDFSLLQKLIDVQVEDKKDYQGFWR